MTFAELIKITTHDQQVKLRIVDTDDVITGSAETLDAYICVELVEAEVVEINAENGVLNVWMKG